MSLANDLLAQARLLARNEPRRPRQASLRRAVSAAYYSVFHLLVEDATKLLVPPNPQGLRLLVRRAFDHNEMKMVCKAFAQTVQPPVSQLIVLPMAPGIVFTARTFVELQEARHDADYNLSLDVSRAAALNYISNAEQAFQKWGIERSTPNGQVFFTALAFNKRWR